jgi:hypothetical protein
MTAVQLRQMAESIGAIPRTSDREFAELQPRASWKKLPFSIPGKNQFSRRAVEMTTPRR